MVSSLASNWFSRLVAGNSCFELVDSVCWGRSCSCSSFWGFQLRHCSQFWPTGSASELDLGPILPSNLLNEAKFMSRSEARGDLHCRIDCWHLQTAYQPRLYCLKSSDTWPLYWYSLHSFDYHRQCLAVSQLYCHRKLYYLWPRGLPSLPQLGSEHLYGPKAAARTCHLSSWANQPLNLNELQMIIEAELLHFFEALKPLFMVNCAQGSTIVDLQPSRYLEC